MNKLFILVIILTLSNHILLGQNDLNTIQIGSRHQIPSEYLDEEREF